MTKLDLGAGPDFAKYLKELDRRIERLSALRSGKATLKRVRVPGHNRPAVYVKTYYRTIIVQKEKSK